MDVSTLVSLVLIVLALVVYIYGLIWAMDQVPDRVGRAILWILLLIGAFYWMYVVLKVFVIA